MPTPSPPPLPEPAPELAPEPPPARATGPASDPWATVLSAAAPNRRLRVIINDCRLVEVKDDLVVLSVSEALLGTARSNEREICDLLATAWDRAVTLELRSEKPEPDAALVAPGLDQEAARAAISEHPLVKRTIELFGAKLVGVQRRKKA